MHLLHCEYKAAEEGEHVSLRIHVAQEQGQKAEAKNDEEAHIDLQFLCWLCLMLSRVLRDVLCKYQDLVAIDH